MAMKELKNKVKGPTKDMVGKEEFKGRGEFEVQALGKTSSEGKKKGNGSIGKC